jgi:hypothetical protein
MIDRKALWILLLLCAAMTATAVWRLSLLPDWHHLVFMTPKGPVTRNGLVLFAPPFSLVFFIAFHSGWKWLTTGPDDARAAWYRSTRLFPIAVGILTTLAQAFNISRSLGHDLSLDGQTFARFILVSAGILTVMQGNLMPKLPRLSQRFALFHLDPWQSARSRRFQGWITVAFGLVMIMAALLLPLPAISPTFFLPLTLIFYAALIWYFVRLKREPSPLP